MGCSEYINKEIISSKDEKGQILDLFPGPGKLSALWVNSMLNS